jgi:hypothetical protein
MRVALEQKPRKTANTPVEPFKARLQRFSYTLATPIANITYMALQEP